MAGFVKKILLANAVGKAAESGFRTETWNGNDLWNGLALSATDFRFIWISGRILIWRLVWEGFSAFVSWRISIIRIFLKASVNSGGDGIFLFQHGFVIMCIFLWEEAGAVWRKTAGIF